MEKRGLVLIVFFIICFVFTSMASARVYLDDGRIELEGIIWMQDMWRSKNLVHEYDFIQGRVQADLKLLVHPVGEKGYLKNLWIIDGIDLRAIGRGVYDYVYDLSNDWGASGGFFSKDVEKNIKRDVDLREAYADIFMGPLSLRVGKQQIVWGKTDFFRLLDVINSLDYSWHFFFESFDDIRIPQKMVKALLSLGNVGFLKDLSLEFDVNPRDFNSTDLGRFGQPWALAPNGFNLIHKFKPDDVQLGGRIQARIGGFSFTINDYYTYQQDPIFNLQKGGLVYPRMNVVGGAVDYYDNFTKSVLRLEMTYVPNKKMGIDFTSPNALNLLGKNPNGIVEKDEIKYCIGIDRPTWITFLNPKQTFFLSAQLFMTHVLDHERGITNDGNATKSVHPIFTFIANTSYINGKLTPQIAWAYDIQGGSHAVLPSIQYLINDYLSIKVGTNLLFSKDKTSRYAGFGAFAENFDEVWVKLQFNF